MNNGKKSALDSFIHMLFSKGIKDPNTYDLQFYGKTLEELFKILLSIYKKGIQILYFPNEEYIDITELTEDIIFKMKQYMNSIGFEPIITSLTATNIIDYTTQFKSILKNPNIYIFCKFSRKLKLPYVNLAIKKTVNMEGLDKCIEDLEKCFKEVPKMKLLLPSMTEKTKLTDYMIKFNIHNNLNVLQFDFV